MKLQPRVHAKFATLAFAAALLAACGGGGGDSGGTSTASGTLRLALTDAPACGYDQVNVTIERVRIHTSATAQDGDAGWSEMVLTPAKRVDLLTLTNGVLEELGSTSLPAGRYTQMRLVLGGSMGPGAMANSLVPSGGSERPMETPSGTQTGLKMNVDIEVAANQLADFVIDFDACRSVVHAGHSGRYLLKPVLSVMPRVTTASNAVEGYVAGAVAAGTTSVSLQKEGAVVRATVPGSNGRFLLSQVPAGVYDLVVRADGRATAVMTGVPVAGTAITVANPSTAPFDPPPSTMRTASGNVVTSGSAAIPDATVRALQTVGATKVELVSRHVDADTGAYSFSLPVAAPVKTAYVAAATSLTFAEESASAGKYTLEVAVPGKNVQTAGIDLTSEDDTGRTFGFAP
ncbi:MAG: DUF4382 domain-containing protein [Burkholderiales bacterium]|nr:MAG: DUF4382 domain-containing protein [Burkholderiales bacterium]